MASSVPSESLFSEAGDQVKDKRNRLDPEKVNKMMVLEGFKNLNKKFLNLLNSKIQIIF